MLLDIFIHPPICNFPRQKNGLRIVLYRAGFSITPSDPELAKKLQIIVARSTKLAIRDFRTLVWLIYGVSTLFGLMTGTGDSAVIISASSDKGLAARPRQAGTWIVAIGGEGSAFSLPAFRSAGFQPALLGPLVISLSRYFITSFFH